MKQMGYDNVVHSEIYIIWFVGTLIFKLNFYFKFLDHDSER